MRVRIMHVFIRRRLIEHPEWDLETARRLAPPLDHAADRVQRWRRNTWYRNETGGKDAEYKPVEEFRR